MNWKIFFSFPLSFHLYTDTTEEILCRVGKNCGIRIFVTLHLQPDALWILL